MQYILDITDIVNKCLCKDGTVTILSKHSTVSVTINEMEGRLVDDTRQFLSKLAPPDYPYLHNDLDYRRGPSDWPGGDEAWRAFRAKEPVNAHSHLIAMLLGDILDRLASFISHMHCVFIRHIRIDSYQ